MKRLAITVLIIMTLTLLIGVPAVSAEPLGWGQVHIVRRGETLSGIAWRYGVSVWAIAQANGIRNINWIYTGQRLVIPDGWGPGPGPGPHPGPGPWPYPGRIHIVRRGETLSLIAWRYGVNMWTLARANGIWNVNLIHVGQRLVIPGYYW